NLSCVGGASSVALQMTGSFNAGSTDTGTFTGTASLIDPSTNMSPGNGPDVMNNVPVALNAKPHTVFTTISGTGLFSSTNAGSTWTQLSGTNDSNGNPRLPAGGNRFAMDITPDGDALYVAVTGLDAQNNGTFVGVFKSTDHGDSWTQVG